MKITAIKAQVKNENRVSIFVDGKYSFSLTLDQLLEQKIKKNDELDENEVKNLKKLSDEGKIKARTIEWLMGRPHSVQELRTYLYKKSVEKDFMESLIEELADRKIVNDEDFARWFAENRARKNKSVRVISAELRAKGVNSNAIQSAVGAIESDDSDALKNLMHKIQDRPRYQDKDKLIRYVLSKGFSYADIKKYLES